MTRILTGMNFIYAGVVKLSDSTAFMHILSCYGLVPEKFLVPVAILLPVTELVAGVGLIFDLRGSLKLISGLLFIYLMVLGYHILTTSNAECGCFSNERTVPYCSLQFDFLLDLGLLVLIFYLIQWERVRNQTWRWK
jgi:uncharacterized membrane protein YphA (DoxX/SURF4 family)